jgi:hypothetical protein
MSRQEAPAQLARRRARRAQTIPLLAAALLATLLAAAPAPAAAARSLLADASNTNSVGNGNSSTWLLVSTAADLITALRSPIVQHIELRKHLSVAEVAAAMGGKSSPFLQIPSNLKSLVVRRSLRDRAVACVQTRLTVDLVSASGAGARQTAACAALRATELGARDRPSSCAA